MKIETTALRVALMRLAAYSAPGTLEEIAALRGMGDAIAKQAINWEASGLQILEEGGFRKTGQGDILASVTLELSSFELASLLGGLQQTRWNPQAVAGLIAELQNLAEALQGWLREAQAAEQWEKLPEKERQIILAKEREKRNKAKKAAGDGQQAG